MQVRIRNRVIRLKQPTKGFSIEGSEQVLRALYGAKARFRFCNLQGPFDYIWNVNFNTVDYKQVQLVLVARDLRRLTWTVHSSIHTPILVLEPACCGWNGAEKCDSCGRWYGEPCPVTPHGYYDQSCFERIKIRS